MLRSKKVWCGMVLLVLLLSSSAFCLETGDAYFDSARDSSPPVTLKSANSISPRASLLPYIINNFITNDVTNRPVQRVISSSGTVYYVTHYMAANTGSGAMYYIISDAMGVAYYFSGFTTSDVANTIMYNWISLKNPLGAGYYKLLTIYFDPIGNIATSEPFTFTIQ